MNEMKCITDLVVKTVLTVLHWYKYMNAITENERLTSKKIKNSSVR